MADRTENIMDLDLNLGPVAPPALGIGPESGRSSGGEGLNLSEWGEPPFHWTIREALRQRTRERWRWRHLHIPIGGLPHGLQLRTLDSNDTINIPDDGLVEGGSDVSLQAGEASVAAEERLQEEPPKTYEDHVSLRADDSVNEKGGIEKTPNEEGSFFNCNICLDLAREPIVTCCGHLFCWPCIYRWLQIYSDAKECPVCKGEVTLNSVTPIYGRGNHTHEPKEDSGIKIPSRPSASRVEGLRQSFMRTPSSFPMEEMIRRLGAQFELTRDFFQHRETDGNHDHQRDRSTLLDRILTSRALRREQHQTSYPAPEDVVDLTQDSRSTETMGGSRRLPPLTYRRGPGQGQGESRHGGGGGLRPLINERLVEAITNRRRSSPGPGHSQEQLAMDDRDSISSIAAGIYGESQTVDTAVEIDSLVSLSSRQTRDGSRTSDVDSGDSRAPRRRRLN